MAHSAQNYYHNKFNQVQIKLINNPYEYTSRVTFEPYDLKENESVIYIKQ